MVVMPRNMSMCLLKTMKMLVGVIMNKLMAIIMIVRVVDVAIGVDCWDWQRYGVMDLI
jgi:hypothetical protein